MIWAEQDPPEAPFFLSHLYFGSRIIPVSRLGPTTPIRVHSRHFMQLKERGGREGGSTWPMLHSHWDRKNPGSPGMQGSSSCVPGPCAGLGHVDLPVLATGWTAWPRGWVMAVSGGESHSLASPNTTLGPPPCSRHPVLPHHWG